ncbi:efflux RND transporter periplasmic adaptor subunit [Cyanothece sp. BG0011]|uniref:efflux RND transporter periplasmic adaptor subunit n=1 Tax=Cyanothece sp. BG0011 TaxID=2082950 RepID=UPI000D1F7D50|nr:efflux RND transporter periplasmic adaptor subunit [Cyanothece sp. BG0011]
MKSPDISSQDVSTSNPEVEEQQKENQTNKPIKGQFRYWLIGIVILGGGITLWQILSPLLMPTPQTNNATPPPKPVETVMLSSETGNQQVRLLGQVEAGEKATLSPQVAGTVEKILVKEGDKVTPGMIIAILDDADGQIALAEAQARLVQEQSNLERLEVGTRSEIIAQRKAELTAAQAREKEALDNLKRLIALQPDLMMQRQAELEAARSREKEAQDNLQRIKGLSLEGALSERALVEAEARADETRNQRLRAEAALKAEETSTRQDIAQGQTRVDNAKSDRLRATAILAEAQAGPTQEEIDAQQGVVKAAQAAVDQAKLRLERTKIRASVSGVVQSREADPGDYVEVNDPILTLVSDRSLDIFLEIPESLSGQITEGMQVNLFARALPNWEKLTQITAVVPAANTNSRRQLVRVSLNNPPEQLLPGMAIQADLIMPIIDKNTFTVPRDALTRRGDQWLLFTVDNNQAEQLEVQLIEDLGENVIISHPQLKKGQSIVIKGGDGLQDDTTVTIIKS